jgi:Ca-activated chloride channel family protein
MKRLVSTLAAIAGVTVVAIAATGWWVGQDDLWASADQRGRYLMRHDRYAEAADAFADPMWRGVALMKATDFKNAEPAFGGLDTAESAYDQGNALVMLGKYDEAITRYDRALALKPGWADAEANRTLAKLRAERVKKTGGDTGDKEQKADDVVYDKDKKNPGGMETQVNSKMSNQAVRDLWLKRVQTRPADFLKARFLYQLQEKKP